MCLSILPLGCFQRIDFCFGFGRFNDHMGGQVAISVFPFKGRIRTSGAVPSGRKFGAAITAIALLDDLMTNSTIIGASFCSHKSTLHTFFNRCAIHWNHPLPALSYLKKTKKCAVKLQQYLCHFKLFTKKVSGI
jgi:hypothetical protein